MDIQSEKHDPQSTLKALVTTDVRRWKMRFESRCTAYRQYY